MTDAREKYYMMSNMLNTIRKITIEDTYKAGLDCGLNGATEQNCHFGYFSSPEHTKAWEKGEKEGRKLLLATGLTTEGER